MSAIGVEALDVSSVLLIAYPEVVRLATVLTDPSFASYLLSPRFSLAEQVWAQEAEGITIMSGSTNTRLGEHRRPGEGGRRNRIWHAPECPQQAPRRAREGAHRRFATTPHLPAAPPQHRTDPDPAVPARTCRSAKSPTEWATTSGPHRLLAISDSGVMASGRTWLRLTVDQRQVDRPASIDPGPRPVLTSGAYGFAVDSRW